MHSKHNQISKFGFVSLSATAALAATVLVAPAAGAATIPGTTVVTTKTVVQAIKPPVIQIKDASMYAGQRKVVARGTKGQAVLTLNLQLKNGRVKKRQVVSRVVLREATPTRVIVGAKAAPVGNIGKWNRIAACESGGNWHINTGNGYFGGLQFLPSTWRAHGGRGMPHQASKMEQIRIAEKVRKASGGYGAWGSCGRR